MPQTGDKQITIVVDGGKLSVEPPIETILPDETMSWYCDTHDYAVNFQDGVTPFKSQKSYFTAQGGQESDVAPAKNLTGGGVDVFKYTVVVHVSGKKPILILDPHIIVDDTGGGHGKKKSVRKSTRKKATKKK